MNSNPNSPHADIPTKPTYDELVAALRRLVNVISYEKHNNQFWPFDDGYAIHRLHRDAFDLLARLDAAENAGAGE